jgi:hypothetical protein
MQNLLYALLYAVAGGQILRYADISFSVRVLCDFQTF